MQETETPLIPEDLPATWEQWQARLPEDRITLAAFRKYLRRAFDAGYDGALRGLEQERDDEIIGSAREQLAFCEGHLADARRQCAALERMLSDCEQERAEVKGARDRG